MKMSLAITSMLLAMLKVSESQFLSLLLNILFKTIAWFVFVYKYKFEDNHFLSCYCKDTFLLPVCKDYSFLEAMLCRLIGANFPGEPSVSIFSVPVEHCCHNKVHDIISQNCLSLTPVATRTSSIVIHNPF